jgi:hypothetical protein
LVRLITFFIGQSDLAPSTPYHYLKHRDRSGITDFEGGHSYITELGPVGRPDHPELNKTLSRYISVIKELFESGKLIPNPYQLIGTGGFEDALTALEHQQKGAGGNKKVVVKIQDPWLSIPIFAWYSELSDISVGMLFMISINTLLSG